MNIVILQETDHWIVCVKPHDVESEHQLPRLLSEQQGGMFYPVHRLDKPTGGVMVYAKDSQTAGMLTRQIKQGEFRKQYYALVKGVPAEPLGTFEDWLYRDGRQNKSYVVKRQRKGVKAASLSYETVETRMIDDRECALVKIQLHTGRTHQIRVQFAARQMPVLGDRKYGGKENDGLLHLWSAVISFQTQTGEENEFCQLPEWAMCTKQNGFIYIKTPF